MACCRCFQARRLTLTDDLKAGARAGTYRNSRMRSGLLVLQCALSLVLLVGAGLFVRSLGNVRDVRLGFDADSVLVASMEMRDVKLDSVGALNLRLRLACHGDDRAGHRARLPPGGRAVWRIDRVADRRRRHRLRARDRPVRVNTVSATTSPTMGTRILRGRSFDDGDRDGAQRVVVLGESMGKALWPGQDPIGKCVRVGIPADAAPCRYVVGVAEDIHVKGFGPAGKFFYYYNADRAVAPAGGRPLRARRGRQARHHRGVRRRLQDEMPGSSYVTVRPLSDLVDVQSRYWVMGATVFTAFGALALILAAVGLYSVIAYNVVQRRQELAVRVALGAAAADVMRLVVGRAFALRSSEQPWGLPSLMQRFRASAPLLFNRRRATRLCSAR